MSEGNILSTLFSNLAQFGEIGSMQFGVVFVFGFDNKASRGVVGVSVNFFNIGLCAVRSVQVVSVFKNFLFCLLNFELIKFEVVTCMIIAAIQPVMLSNGKLKIGLQFFKCLGG